ncbi:MAG: aspartate kinase, partial [Bdellovibrionales bacterium]|nr:aspartate kinase [Bdellovibrionales bacterium]
VDCEIFTDVDGVYTADPRVVPTAQKIQSLTYDEMMEMAALGSKVLHFRCVEIGAKYKVPIHVRSTFTQTEGTWIKEENTTMEAPVVSAITHDAKIVVLSAEPVPEGVAFLADLFKKLADKDIVIDIISQSKGAVGQRIAFSVPDEDLTNAKAVLEDVATREATLKVVQDAAKVSIVGVGMLSHPGVAARFFDVFKKHNVDIQMVTTSDIKMSAVVARTRLEDAVKGLHTEFGLDK